MGAGPRAPQTPAREDRRRSGESARGSRRRHAPWRPIPVIRRGRSRPLRQERSTRGCRSGRRVRSAVGYGPPRTSSGTADADRRSGRLGAGIDMPEPGRGATASRVPSRIPEARLAGPHAAGSQPWSLPEAGSDRSAVTTVASRRERGRWRTRHRRNRVVSRRRLLRRRRGVASGGAGAREAADRGRASARGARDAGSVGRRCRPAGCSDPSPGGEGHRTDCRSSQRDEGPVDTGG